MTRTQKRRERAIFSGHLIVGLPYQINNRLRYSHAPDLGLNEFSTREELQRVRHLIPDVRGIGPVALAEIDRWLDAAPG